jgi:hypothetical protein
MAPRAYPHVPDCIEQAVESVINDREANGLSEAAMLTDAGIIEITERALERIVINPDTPANRRSARRLVAVALGNRYISE